MKKLLAMISGILLLPLTVLANVHEKFLLKENLSFLDQKEVISRDDNCTMCDRVRGRSSLTISKEEICELFGEKSLVIEDESSENDNFIDCSK